MPGLLLTTAANTAITSIVGGTLMPTLKKVAKGFRLKYRLNVVHLGSHFQEYLKRTYSRFSVINTLAFRNQQKLLREIYLPLTLVSEGLTDTGKPLSVTVKDFPSELFSKYKKVLIADMAGMGKSTLSKIMFLSAIDKQAGIPIFIELRNISQTHGLYEEIREQLGSLTEEFDRDLMLSLFQAGGFVFFFDGYDEVPLGNRPFVAGELKSFIDRANDNLFVLTSRYDKSLVGFGDFISMRIRPLSKDESYQLLRNYDSNGETSRRLVNILKSDDNSSISVFLKNPLLLSLLFIGFDYKPEIPIRIHLFYYQVYEALFNTHDLSKDASFIHKKESQLDLVDFFRFLRALGFICFYKKQDGFSQSDFLSVLGLAKKLSGITDCSEEALQDDLLLAVPVFYKDGLLIKWVHKSFMEYFASEFIYHDSGEKKKAILNELVNGEDCVSNLTLLEFYSNLDSRAFQKEIVLPILSEFVSFMERPINSEDSQTMERIRRRRQFLFHCDTYLYLFDRHNKDLTFGELSDTIDSVIPNPCDNIGAHIWGEDLMVSVFYPDNEFEIIQFILKKYPKLKARNNSDIECDSTQFPSSQLCHYTEDLMLMSPDDYDRLDYLNFGSIWGEPQYHFLDYSESKIMVAEISNTQNESETLLGKLVRS